MAHTSDELARELAAMSVPMSARARAFEARVQAALKVFVEGIRAVCALAPCEFCRPSSLQFVGELERDGDSLDDRARRGALVRAVYELRNKVNGKLATQHMHKELCIPKTSAPCCVPPRAISYDNFMKRVALRGLRFTADDVLTFLHALYLDYGGPKCHAYAQLIRALHQLCKVQWVLFGQEPRFDARVRQLLEVLTWRQTRAPFPTEPCRSSLRELIAQLTRAIVHKPFKGPCRGDDPDVQSAFDRHKVMAVGVVCANETCAV